MDIRPLTENEAARGAGLALAAWPPDDPGRHAERLAWVTRRIGHLRRTDPGGAWAAEIDGEVVGIALAFVREDIWGLSLLLVDPERHARGIGGRLLDAALAYAGGGRGAIILSSTDPRAMRLYARAGFALRPCVALAGIVDRDAIPGGLRSRPSDDVEQAAELARPARGGAYGPADLEMLRGRPRGGLLLLEGRGFVIHEEGSPIVLAASDEAAATDLLWSAFAAGPRGGTVHAEFLTAGQDWAIRVGLEARLVLSPDGPIYTRGDLGPLRPWIPSGSLL